MDDLDVLRTLAPDRLAPTDEERAAARRELLGAIDRSTSDTPTARRSRPSRRVWYAAATAAAVVAAALVGTAVVDDGPGSLSPRPAAAVQLRQLAVLGAEATDPAVPFVVETTVVEIRQGGDESSYDLATYVMGDGDQVVDLSRCLDVAPSPDWPCQFIFPMGPPYLSGSWAGIESELERSIDQMVVATGATRDAATLEVVASALQAPGVSADARSGLLQLIAETGEIRAEPEVAAASGLVGTLFSVDTDWGTLGLVIDPDDGYLLESRVALDRARAKAVGHHIEGNRTGRRVTYRRPRTVTDLPEAVATGRQLLVDHADELEANLYLTRARNGTEECVGAYETIPPTQTPLPHGIFISHCFPVG